MSAQVTYGYKARDSHGEIVSGTIAASSAEEVGARLRAEGKYVLNVSEHALRSETGLDDYQIRRNEMAKRVSREDVITFCQQLSVMLETGVPLSEALDAFCRQIEKRELQEVIKSLHADIEGGEPFSTAMAKWPRVFPSMMISLMRASEESGSMSMMLGRIGDYLAKERRTARQVKGALGYPIFMMTIALALTVFLMAFVLPRFASIYEMRSAALPTPTVILMGISNFVTSQYLIYGPVLFVLIVGVTIWVRKPSGRRACDWLRLNTPIIGGMYRQLYITRFTRTMGTLLAAGVNLLDIIDICRGVTNNRYYDELWDEMTRQIRDGNQLSEPLFESSLIPANVASMIASGERSSRLAEVMERIAAFSEEELETAIKQMTSYIEPIMILTMGILVGGVALALLLPVFRMGNVMAGS
ncbi:MAG: type II secretion system F family protein [Phycisphaerales bacterium]|nr:MAG: type II secretion system F family protein [Phycisphaerales bacterium]